MAYYFSGHSAELLMYPQQIAAPPKWRVRGSEIEMLQDGKVATRYAYAIRGDTLDLRTADNLTIKYRRVAPNPPGMATIGGAWRSQGQRETFVVTFRSDSAFVLEAVLPVRLTMKGDTLEAYNPSANMRMRSVLRRSGNELVMTQLDATPQTRASGPSSVRLTRRPWGCFGVAALDGAGCQPRPHPGEAQAPYVALHLAYPDSAAGRLRVQHGDSAIYLAQDPVLSDNDFARVDALARPGRSLILQVHCLPAACARLAAITAQHVGTHLAVLVGSQVRGAAPIAGSVGAHGSLTIAIDAVGAEADRIVAQVRSRWPVRE